MKNGDIYKWSYKESTGDQTLLYWCKSRIAVVVNGVLKDTYWSNGSHHEHGFLDPERVDLEFIANFKDLTPIQQYEVKYFDEKDIVDITNQNSFQHQIFLRKGAVKSLEKIKEGLQREIESKEGEVSYLTGRILDLKKSLDNLSEENKNSTYF